MHTSIIELENTYGNVNGRALQEVLTFYDMHGGLLNAIKSIYNTESACVTVNIDKREWCEIQVGVYQVVISPRLFNVFKDGAFCEMGVKLEHCCVLLHGTMAEHSGSNHSCCLWMMFSLLNQRKIIKW